MPKHVFVALSSHGFGHLSQTACIINALKRIDATIHVSVQTTLPKEIVALYLTDTFHYIKRASDFGMVMESALDVKKVASWQNYVALHSQWAVAIEQEATFLAQINPDLVLSNISYLSLAGAAQANIATVACCSLNWAEIFNSYFSKQPNAILFYQQMIAAYNTAYQFYQPAPSMDMPLLDNLRPVGSLARIGEDKRQYLNHRFDQPADNIYVLLSFGGIDMPRRRFKMPKISGVTWLITNDNGVERDDVVTLEKLGISFIDAMASSAVVITKLGYGIVTEAVYNNTRVLYIKRGDWVEEDALVKWLNQHGCAAEISRQQWATGQLSKVLQLILASEVNCQMIPTGAQTIAQEIQQAYL